MNKAKYLIKSRLITAEEAKKEYETGLYKEQVGIFFDRYIDIEKEIEQLRKLHAEELKDTGKPLYIIIHIERWVNNASKGCRNIIINPEGQEFDRPSLSTMAIIKLLVNREDAFKVGE